LPGYPECPVCPYKDDPGKTCHAFAAKNRRICELIEVGRQWEARVVELTEADPNPPPPPAAPAPQPPPVVTEGADPVPIAAVLERIELMKGCDYRGPIAQCGCTPLRVCWVGKGTRPDPEEGYGHVTERDCMACRSSDSADVPA